MIKKKLTALLSGLLAVMIAMGLLVFPFGANDVTAHIDITDFKLAVNRGGVETTIYHNIPVTLPDGFKLQNNEEIVFDLSWVNKDGYTFLDGDTVVIPVIKTDEIASFMNHVIDLDIDSTTVATGTFSRTTQGGKDLLLFTIVFNAAAPTKTVGGGFATGSVTVGISDTSTPFWFGFNVDWTEYPSVPPPPPTIPRPEYPGVGPWPDMYFPQPPDPLPSVRKGVMNASGSLVPSEEAIGVATDIYAALPDRSGKTFPSFRWDAAFTGLYDAIDANRALVTDDVILEDTISANMAFSNFANPLTGVDYGGMLYKGFRNQDPAKAYGKTVNGTTVRSCVNDFFYLDLAFPSFGWSSNYGLNSGYGVPQAELVQITDDAAKAIYSSQYQVVAASAIIATVKSTSLSYAVIDNADGTATLIINSGKFGQTADGIAPENIFNFGQTSAAHGGASDDPRYNPKSKIGSMINSATYDHNRLIKALALQEDTPYARAMEGLNKMETELIALERTHASGKAAEFIGANSSYQYANTTAYDAAYALAMTDFAALKTAFATWSAPGIPATNWPAENLLYYTTETRNFANLYSFFAKLTDNRTSSDFWNPPDDTELRYITTRNILEISRGFDDIFNAYNYKGKMERLAADLQNTVIQRDGIIKSILFHYPDMRTEFARLLHMPQYDSTAAAGNPNYRLTAADVTDAQIIQEMFQDPADLTFTDAVTRTPKASYAAWNARYKALIGYGASDYKLSSYHSTAASGSSEPSFFKDFSVATFSLVYRTIMTDTSVAKVSNEMKAYTSTHEWSQDVWYRYRFSAGIYGTTKGGAMFGKADAAANSKSPGWATVTDPDAISALNTKLSGAKFSIYTSQADAIAGANTVKFKTGAETNTYEYDPSGGISEITTSANGAYYLYGFPSAGATFWIKETAPPSNYLPFTTPFSFTVTANGSSPNCYVLYDEAGPSTGSLIISKTVENTAITSDTFTFTVKKGGLVVDLTTADITVVAGNYTATDLAGGQFTMTRSTTVKIANLAPGDDYTVEESNYTGYLVSYKVNGVGPTNGSTTGNVSVVSGGESLVAFTNRYPTLTAPLTIPVSKTLQGIGTTTTVFTFDLLQVSDLDGTAMPTGGTSPHTDTKQLVGSGSTVFTLPSDLTAGTYYYKITERQDSTDPNWSYDTREYIAKIVIALVGSDLEVTGQTYHLLGQTATTLKIDFENTFSPYTDFIFKKTDKDGVKLTGVEFKLYSCTLAAPHVHSALVTNDLGCCWNADPPFQTAVSDENGMVSLTDLPSGDFMLVETKTNAGFQLPTGQWLFRVDATAQTIDITAVRGLGGDLPPAFKVTDEGAGVLTYALPNYPKLMLPSGGGISFILSTIAGLVMFSSAMLLWILNGRRKRKKIVGISW